MLAKDKHQRSNLIMVNNGRDKPKQVYFSFYHHVIETDGPADFNHVQMEALSSYFSQKFPGKQYFARLLLSSDYHKVESESNLFHLQNSLMI